MNQVLAAERDARAAVDTCREEARRILDEAEARVRGISRRTERRVKAAHRIADAAVERTLAGLRDRATDDARVRAAEMDQERLGQAVDRLVEEIVGGLP